MTVTVEIAGILRRPDGRARVALSLEGSATIADVLTALGYREDERRVLRVGRGPEILRPTDAVADGDALTVFAQIGGG